MDVSVKHKELTQAATALEGLADRIDAQRRSASGGTPVDLPTLSDSTLGAKATWMRDQLPMLYGLAAIGLLLDEDGDKPVTFSVGDSVDDILDLLGDTLAERTASGLGYSQMAIGTLSDWMVKGKLGRFSPRGANGRYIAFKNSPAWKNALRSASKTNWQAKPYQSATRAKWLTTGKWVGRAGVVLSFGTAAYDQWTADSNDPTMETSEKVGRATTKGLTTAAGAWGGAQLGATIGSFGGPVGTVAGALIGGAIGGFIGSGAGDVVLDVGKDAIKNFSEGVADVGDKLSFWD